MQPVNLGLDDETSKESFLLLPFSIQSDTFLRRMELTFGS